MKTNLLELLQDAHQASIEYSREPTKHNLAVKYVASLAYNGALSAYYAAQSGQQAIQ